MEIVHRYQQYSYCLCDTYIHKSTTNSTVTLLKTIVD